MLSSFKADRNAPMNIESDTLELLDASNKTVFEGDVRARQGDLLVRTSELTAFYSGQTGTGFGNPADAAAAKAKGQEKGEIVRLEARRTVILESKDQSATADWADFNVKDNTALLGALSGGKVTVTQVANAPLNPDVLRGERLKVNLTTGISQFEAAEPASPQRSPPPPVVSSGDPGAPAPTPKERVDSCGPGRTCVLIHPKRVNDKALDVLKKKAPGVTVP